VAILTDDHVIMPVIPSGSAIRAFPPIDGVIGRQLVDS
jgi:hypothetical protein